MENYYYIGIALSVVNRGFGFQYRLNDKFFAQFFGCLLKNKEESVENIKIPQGRPRFSLIYIYLRSSRWKLFSTAKEALLILIRAAILVLIYSLTHRARVSLNSPLLVCIHSRLIWIQTALIMATCSTPRPRSNMFYVLIKLTGMLKRYFMVKGLWFYWNYIFQIFHVCSFICFLFLIKFEGFGKEKEKWWNVYQQIVY